MDLYVIRHGQVPSNVKKLVGCYSDEELTEKGVEQAINMNNKLQDVNFDIVYCSPVLRAIQTAKIIVPRNELIYDSRIGERFFGDMLGRPRSEIDRSMWDSLDYDKTVDGVETFGSGIKRTREFINEISLKHFDKTILVVTHNFISKCIWIIENEIQDMGQINFYHKNGEIKHYSRYMGQGRR